MSWTPLRSAEQLGPLVLFFALQLRKVSTLKGADSSVFASFRMMYIIRRKFEAHCPAPMHAVHIASSAVMCSLYVKHPLCHLANPLDLQVLSFFRTRADRLSRSPRTLHVSSGFWRCSSWLLPSSSPQAGSAKTLRSFNQQASPTGARPQAW